MGGNFGCTLEEGRGGGYMAKPYIPKKGTMMLTKHDQVNLQTET
jgi:hypothetical protein